MTTNTPPILKNIPPSLSQRDFVADGFSLGALSSSAARCLSQNAGL